MDLSMALAQQQNITKTSLCKALPLTIPVQVSHHLLSNSFKPKLFLWLCMLLKTSTKEDLHLQYISRNKNRMFVS